VIVNPTLCISRQEFLYVVLCSFLRFICTGSPLERSSSMHSARWSPSYTRLPHRHLHILAIYAISSNQALFLSSKHISGNRNQSPESTFSAHGYPGPRQPSEAPAKENGHANDSRELVSPHFLVDFSLKYMDTTTRSMCSVCKTHIPHLRSQSVHGMIKEPCRRFLTRVKRAWAVLS